MQKPNNVLIIGAGCSGLEAAKTLLSKGIPFTIFEASDRACGRVRDCDDWVDFNLDLGAEFIHGENSEHRVIAEKFGVQKRHLEDSDQYLQYQDSLVDYEQAQDIDDIKKAFEIYENIESQSGDAQEDLPFSEYLNKQNLTEDAHRFVGGLLSENYGNCDMSKLSIKSMSACGDGWTLGYSHYLNKNMTQCQVIKKNYEEIIKNVKLNTPIAKVEVIEENHKVVIEDIKGNRYEGASIICTAPLAILKKKMIQFSPSLPKKKQNAIKTLDTAACFKLFLRFNKVFWPEGAGSLIIKGKFPIFFISSSSKVSKYGVMHILFSGPEAPELLKLGKEKIAQMAVRQLESQFGSIAADSYVDCYMANWAEEPYIQGGYSYPVFNQGNCREELAALDGRLVFAGEHCSPYHYATITGAIQSGRRAAEYMIEMLERQDKKVVIAKNVGTISANIQSSSSSSSQNIGDSVPILQVVEASTN